MKCPQQANWSTDCAHCAFQRASDISSVSVMPKSSGRGGKFHADITTTELVLVYVGGGAVIITIILWVWHLIVFERMVERDYRRSILNSLVGMFPVRLFEKEHRMLRILADSGPVCPLRDNSTVNNQRYEGFYTIVSERHCCEKNNRDHFIQLLHTRTGGVQSTHWRSVRRQWKFTYGCARKFSKQ